MSCPESGGEGARESRVPVFSSADPPPTIQRAIARISSPGFPLALTAQDVHTFATLLHRVDRFGEKTFWVKRENLGEILGCCERTVTNRLNALEGRGLITKAQGRLDWGSFNCVMLQLTPLAIGLLGLDQPLRKALPDPRQLVRPGPDHQASALDSDAPGKDFSARFYEETAFEDQSSSKRQPAELSTATNLAVRRGFLKENPKTEQPTANPHPRSGGQVPGDCQALLDLGLTRYGVFRLMRRATTAGKRLADIVAVRHDAIASARQAYALVDHLIHDNIDYAALRSMQAAQRANQECEQLRQQEADAFAAVKAQMKGCWFVVPEPDVPDDRACVRVHVPEHGRPEVHQLDGSQRWRYQRVLMGQDEEAFWARQDHWRTMRRLQINEEVVRNEARAARDRLRSLSLRLRSVAGGPASWSRPAIV